MLSVKIPVMDDKGKTTTKECVTQQGIFDTAKTVLADRFSGVFSLSFFSGRLFGNLGFMGDSKYTEQVLEGTYDFPE